MTDANAKPPIDRERIMSAIIDHIYEDAEPTVRQRLPQHDWELLSMVADAVVALLACAPGDAPTETEGERHAVMVISEQTRRDEHDQQWFNSGWEACRREVLALAEHQGDEAAVKWASGQFAEPAGHAE